MQFDPVDIRLLRVFMALVEQNGFAGAQVELGLTASTLSLHLTNLEKRLGLRLCERGRSGFRLTENGRRVHEGARRVFLAMEDFRSEAAALRGELAGELSLGLVDNTLTDPRAPMRAALDAFAAQAPQVHITVSIDRPAGLMRSLVEQRLHVAIGAFPYKVSRLTYQPLYDELHLLYCGGTHDLYSLADREIDEDMIAQAPLAGRGYDLEQDLRITGAARHAATVENMEAQALLTLTGRFVGFLPVHYAAAWVAGGELRAVRPDRYRYVTPIQVATPGPDHQTRIIRAFLEALAAANRDIAAALPDTKAAINLAGA